MNGTIEMSQTVESRLTVVEKDQAEFRNVVREIRDISSRQADSLEKLVRLEERHAESREAIGRAFSEIAKQNDEIDVIKIEVGTIKVAIPPLVEVRNWLVNGGIGIVAIVFIALISLVVKQAQ